MDRERPVPPFPEIVRRPGGRGFGWLDARILHDGWLARLGADAIAVITFLSLAADARGASFYGRERMAATLGIERSSLDRALHRLLEIGLIAHRPWRAGHRDGVWQVLPLPAASRRTQPAGPTSLRDLVAELGFTPPQQT